MSSVDPSRTVTSIPEPEARIRIIAAARRHFFAHGFRSVTMDDLATELGMSKKTFYAHFPSKAAVVKAVMTNKLDCIEADLESITACPDAGFTSVLSRLLSCIQQHTGEVQPAFLRDLRRDAPEVFEQLESRRSETIQRCFTRCLAAGRRTGRIRQDLPLNLIIEILLAATQAIMNPRKLEQLRLSPQAGYDAILKVILGGAMTMKGGARP